MPSTRQLLQSLLAAFFQGLLFLQHPFFWHRPADCSLAFASRANSPHQDETTWAATTKKLGEGCEKLSGANDTWMLTSKTATYIRLLFQLELFGKVLAPHEAHRIQNGHELKSLPVCVFCSVKEMKFCSSASALRRKWEEGESVLIDILERPPFPPALSAVTCVLCCEWMRRPVPHDLQCGR